MPAPPKPKIAYRPVPRPRQCPVTPVGSLRAVVSSRAQWDRRGRGGTAAGAVGPPRAQWDRRERSGIAAGAVGSPRAQWDRRERGGIAAGAVSTSLERSESGLSRVAIEQVHSAVKRPGDSGRESEGPGGAGQAPSNMVPAPPRGRGSAGVRDPSRARATGHWCGRGGSIFCFWLSGTLITMGGTKSHGGPRVRGCWGGGPEVLGFNNVRVSPSTSIRINAVSNAIWGPGTCHEGQGSPGEWQKQQGSRRERASGSCVQRLNKIMSAVLSIYDSGRLVLCRVMTSHRPYAWPRAAPCNQPDQRCPHPPPNPVCRSRAPPRGPPLAARGAAARWPRAGLE
eukprot:gene769-biopygen12176